MDLTEGKFVFEKYFEIEGTEEAEKIAVAFKTIVLMWSFNKDG